MNERVVRRNMAAHAANTETLADSGPAADRLRLPRWTRDTTRRCPDRVLRGATSLAPVCAFFLCCGLTFVLR